MEAHDDDSLRGEPGLRPPLEVVTVAIGVQFLVVLDHVPISHAWLYFQSDVIRVANYTSAPSAYSSSNVSATCRRCGSPAISLTDS